MNGYSCAEGRRQLLQLLFRNGSWQGSLWLGRAHALWTQKAPMQTTTTV